MIDKGIEDFIKKVNSMGLETVASCSGLREDHHGEKRTAYVCFRVGEDVEPDFKKPLSFPPSRASPFAHRLANAIEDAGWDAVFMKFMLTTPVVCAYIKEPVNYAYKIYGKVTRDDLTYNERKTIEEIEACNKKIDEALTDDVMKRKWKQLEKELTEEFGGDRF